MALQSLTSLTSSGSTAKTNATALLGVVVSTTLTSKYANVSVTDSIYADAQTTNGVLDDIVTAIENMQAVLPIAL